MRISDWSSDVCSSDLQLVGNRVQERAECGVLVVAARDPAVEPVGDRGQAEHRRGGEIGPLVGQVEHQHQRSEEHTSELQSLMRISYAVFCLKKKTHTTRHM